MFMKKTSRQKLNKTLVVVITLVILLSMTLFSLISMLVYLK